MPLDLVLFALRLLSGMLLLAIVGCLFILLWRDFRNAAHYADNSRRVYGQLIALAQLDDLFSPIGESYPLLPHTSIGRAATNSIVVDDTFASSEHATLALRGGQWWLEDQESRNGTLLNGEPIDEGVIVTDGDVIGIGQISFRISLN